LAGERLRTIALVTLIRSTTEKAIPARELMEEIQTAIQSSKISKGWSIEKISILGESGIPEQQVPPNPAKKHRRKSD